MQIKNRPRLLLCVLTGLNLLNYIDRFVLASLVEKVKAAFTLSDWEAGALSTAFMIGYFLTSPIFGYFGDRAQRRLLIAGGIFVWSLATVLTGYAGNFTTLLLLRVAVGVGEASYATLSPAIISDCFPPARRNMALTVFYVAIPVGAAIGTLFGSWIGTHYGWSEAFIWAGAPGLILAFSILLFEEPERGQTDVRIHSHAVTPPTFRDILGLLKLKRYTLAVAGYIAYSFAMGAYQYWGQAFLIRIHGISLESSGNFFGGVMVVTGILGTFIGGYLGTRLQRRSPAGYSILLGLSVFLSLPFVLLFTVSNSMIVIKFSLAASMLLLFLPTGPVNTVLIEAVPINLRASAMALSIFCIHAFGDLWSPMLVGYVSDYFNSLRAGLIILPFALGICAILWLTLVKFPNQESVST